MEKKPEVNKNICFYCKYMKHKKSIDYAGYCQRYPHYIAKQAYDWCGEFVKEPEKETE